VIGLHLAVTVYTLQELVNSHTGGGISYNERMSTLSITPIEPLLGEAQQRHYPKGQIILYQGDSPPYMFLLKQGEIKVYDIDEQGNEKILYIMRPGSIFPFASYLARKTEVMWFYAALSDVVAYAISYEDLSSQLNKDPRLALYLLEKVTTDTHEAFVRIASMSKTTTRPKLVAALKFLCVYHTCAGKSGWRRVNFSTSHQLLADMTGITRESATLAMKQLQDEKITRSPKLGILEINFDRLIEHG
jgi:CRP-like cAMP-binding protein